MKFLTTNILFFISIISICQSGYAQELQNQVEINFVTYNIAGLPDTLTSSREVSKADKRFPVIANFLKQFDVIGIQEIFIPERHIIEDKLKTYYLVHGTDTGNITKMYGSGVYIFSRWPILKSAFETWDQAEDYDSVSHKGFVIATTKVSEDLQIDIYSLHAQAGHQYVHIRENQYKQFHSALKKYSLGQGRPVIIMGDFNSGPNKRDEYFAFENDMGMKNVNDELKGVDHILYSDNKSEWSIEVVQVKKIEMKRYEGKRLSDHEPVCAKLRFIRNK